MSKRLSGRILSQAVKREDKAVKLHRPHHALNEEDVTMLYSSAWYRRGWKRSLHEPLDKVGAPACSG